MDWSFNTIWFDQLDPDKVYKKDYKEKVSLADNFVNSEYAILWYYKSKAASLDSLEKSDKLLYLELNSANIFDFKGIERYENLKRLELHYCTKLKSDLGLKALRQTLQILHIDQSKQFIPTDELTQLKELKSLRLNSCSPIDNLHFLYSFPKLIDFRFVNTNVVTGDLTPILSHPTIRSVGFSNKRHYNYTSQQLEIELSKKSTKEYREVQYNGEYSTFKYKSD